MSLARLPSLDLLRAFVAVGRRMSITQAADDLCITQSAMSKQIRLLEDRLGTPLLVRGHRSITLTADGERLFRVASASVQQLQDVVAQLGQPGRRPVTITTTISVASLWLLPRLGDFQRRHPGIDVRLATTNTVLDLQAGDIDVAIRYGPAAQAPANAIPLFDEAIAPVASPALHAPALEAPEHLGAAVLLEYEDRRPWLQWSDWLAAHGWTLRQARGVLRFNHYDQAIQAAVAGQGIALGRLKLLEPMLADGRLCIVPSARGPQPTPAGYWLLQAAAQPREDVLQVVRWIREAGAAAGAVTR